MAATSGGSGASRNDFFVEFGSNASEFATRLARDLEPAHDQIKLLEAALDQLHGKTTTNVRLAQLAASLAQNPKPGTPRPAGQPPVRTGTTGRAGSADVDFSKFEAAIDSAAANIASVTSTLALAANLFKESAEDAKRGKTRRNRSEAQLDSPASANGRHWLKNVDLTGYFDKQGNPAKAGRRAPVGAPLHLTKPYEPRERTRAIRDVPATPAARSAERIEASKPKPASSRDVTNAQIDKGSIDRIVKALDKNVNATGKVETAVDRLREALVNGGGIPGSRAGGAAPAPAAPSDDRRSSGRRSDPKEWSAAQIEHRLKARDRYEALKVVLDTGKAGGKVDPAVLERALGGARKLTELAQQTGGTGEKWVAALQKALENQAQQIKNLPSEADLRRMLERERGAEPATATTATSAAPVGARAAVTRADAAVNGLPAEGTANDLQLRIGMLETALSGHVTNITEAQRQLKALSDDPALAALPDRAERVSKLKDNIADWKDTRDTIEEHLKDHRAMLAALDKEATAPLDVEPPAPLSKRAARRERKRVAREEARAERAQIEATTGSLDSETRARRRTILESAGQPEYLRRSRTTTADLQEILKTYAEEGYEDKYVQPGQTHFTDPDTGKRSRLEKERHLVPAVERVNAEYLANDRVTYHNLSTKTQIAKITGRTRKALAGIMEVLAYSEEELESIALLAANSAAGGRSDRAWNARTGKDNLRRGRTERGILLEAGGALDERGEPIRGGIDPVAEAQSTMASRDARLAQRAVQEAIVIAMRANFNPFQPGVEESIEGNDEEAVRARKALSRARHGVGAVDKVLEEFFRLYDEWESLSQTAGALRAELASTQLAADAGDPEATRRLHRLRERDEHAATMADNARDALTGMRFSQDKTNPLYQRLVSDIALDETGLQNTKVRHAHGNRMGTPDQPGSRAYYEEQQEELRREARQAMLDNSVVASSMVETLTGGRTRTGAGSSNETITQILPGIRALKDLTVVPTDPNRTDIPARDLARATKQLRASVSAERKRGQIYLETPDTPEGKADRQQRLTEAEDVLAESLKRLNNAYKKLNVGVSALKFEEYYPQTRNAEGVLERATEPRLRVIYENPDRVSTGGRGEVAGMRKAGKMGGAYLPVAQRTAYDSPESGLRNALLEQANRKARLGTLGELLPGLNLNARGAGFVAENPEEVTRSGLRELNQTLATYNEAIEEFNKATGEEVPDPDKVAQAVRAFDQQVETVIRLYEAMQTAKSSNRSLLKVDERTGKIALRNIEEVKKAVVGVQDAAAAAAGGAGGGGGESGGGTAAAAGGGEEPTSRGGILNQIHDTLRAIHTTLKAGIPVTGAGGTGRPSEAEATDVVVANQSGSRIKGSRLAGARARIKEARAEETARRKKELEQAERVEAAGFREGEADRGQLRYVPKDTQARMSLSKAMAELRAIPTQAEALRDLAAVQAESYAQLPERFKGPNAQGLKAYQEHVLQQRVTERVGGAPTPLGDPKGDEINRRAYLKRRREMKEQLLAEGIKLPTAVPQAGTADATLAKAQALEDSLPHRAQVITELAESLEGTNQAVGRVLADTFAKRLAQNAPMSDINELNVKDTGLEAMAERNREAQLGTPAERELREATDELTAARMRLARLENYAAQKGAADLSGPIAAQRARVAQAEARVNGAEVPEVTAPVPAVTLPLGQVATGEVANAAAKPVRTAVQNKVAKEVKERAKTTRDLINEVQDAFYSAIKARDEVRAAMAGGADEAQVGLLRQAQQEAEAAWRAQAAALAGSERAALSGFAQRPEEGQLLTDVVSGIDQEAYRPFVQGRHSEEVAAQKARDRAARAVSRQTPEQKAAEQAQRKADRAAQTAANKAAREEEAAAKRAARAAEVAANKIAREQESARKKAARAAEVARNKAAREAESARKKAEREAESARKKAEREAEKAERDAAKGTAAPKSTEGKVLTSAQQTAALIKEVQEAFSEAIKARDLVAAAIARGAEEGDVTGLRDIQARAEQAWLEKAEQLAGGPEANGRAAALSGIARRASEGQLVTDVISAADVEAYKPFVAGRHTQEAQSRKAAERAERDAKRVVAEAAAKKAAADEAAAAELARREEIRTRPRTSYSTSVGNPVAEMAARREQTAQEKVDAAQAQVAAAMAGTQAEVEARLIRAEQDLLARTSRLSDERETLALLEARQGELLARRASLADEASRPPAADASALASLEGEAARTRALADQANAGVQQQQDAAMAKAVKAEEELARRTQRLADEREDLAALEARQAELLARRSSLADRAAEEKSRREAALAAQQQAAPKKKKRESVEERSKREADALLAEWFGEDALTERTRLGQSVAAAPTIPAEDPELAAAQEAVENELRALAARLTDARDAIGSLESAAESAAAQLPARPGPSAATEAEDAAVAAQRKLDQARASQTDRERSTREAARLAELEKKASRAAGLAAEAESDARRKYGDDWRSAPLTQPGRDPLQDPIFRQADQTSRGAEATQRELDDYRASLAAQAAQRAALPAPTGPLNPEATAAQGVVENELRALGARLADARESVAGLEVTTEEATRRIFATTDGQDPKVGAATQRLAEATQDLAAAREKRIKAEATPFTGWTGPLPNNPSTVSATAAMAPGQAAAVAGVRTKGQSTTEAIAEVQAAWKAAIKARDVVREAMARGDQGAADAARAPYLEAARVWRERAVALAGGEEEALAGFNRLPINRATPVMETTSALEDEAYRPFVAGRHGITRTRELAAQRAAQVDNKARKDAEKIAAIARKQADLSGQSPEPTRAERIAARSAEERLALDRQMASILPHLTDETRDQIAALRALGEEEGNEAERLERLIQLYARMRTELDMAGRDATGVQNAFRAVTQDMGMDLSQPAITDIGRTVSIDENDRGAVARARRAGVQFGSDMGVTASEAFAAVMFGNNGFWGRVMNSTGTFLVRNFSAGLVFGLSAALGDVVRQAIETESTFVRVSHALESTGRASEDLRTDLGEISTEYGVALSDVYNTAAGLTGLFEGTNEIAGATRVATQLQMISNGALNASEAMGVLASTSSAFGLTGVEGLNHVADVLTVIQNELGVNVEVAAEGISRMSGLAAQLGLTLEETGVYVSEIAKRTNQTGAAAGEQFSRIVAAMQTQRGQGVLSETLGEFGIEGALNASEYSDALEILMGNYSKLSKAEQSRIAIALGGQRQAAALAALLNDGARALEVVEKATDATGAAEERAAKITETLNAQLDRFQQGLVSLGATVIQSGVLNFFIEGLQRVNDMTQAVLKLVGAFNDFATANPLIGDIRNIILGLVGLLVAFRAVKGGVAGLRAYMAADSVSGAALRGAAGQRLTGVVTGSRNAPGSADSGDTRTPAQIARQQTIDRVRRTATTVQATPWWATRMGNTQATGARGIGAGSATRAQGLFARGLEKLTTGPVQLAGRGLTNLATSLNWVANQQRTAAAAAAVGSRPATILNRRATVIERTARPASFVGRQLDLAARRSQLMQRGYGDVVSRARTISLRNTAEAARARAAAPGTGRLAPFAAAGNRALAATAAAGARVTPVMARMTATMRGLGLAAMGAQAALGLLLVGLIAAFTEASYRRNLGKTADDILDKRLGRTGEPGGENGEDGRPYVGPATDAFNAHRERTTEAGMLQGSWQALGEALDVTDWGRRARELLQGDADAWLDRSMGNLTEEQQDIVNEFQNRFLSGMQEKAGQVDRGTMTEKGLADWAKRELDKNNQDLDKLLNPEDVVTWEPNAIPGLPAKRVVTPGKKPSEAQALALQAAAESYDEFYEDFVAEQTRVLQGLGKLGRLNMETIDQLTGLASTLVSTPAMAMNYSTAMDALFAEAGLMGENGDKQLTEIFGVMTSGTATAAQMIDAQIALTERAIAEDTATLNSAVALNNDPDKIQAARDQLMAQMSQAESLRRQRIDVEVKGAQDMAQLMSARGDHTGAAAALRTAAASLRQGIAEAHARNVADEAWEKANAEHRAAQEAKYAASGVVGFYVGGKGPVTDLPRTGPLRPDLVGVQGTYKSPEQIAADELAALQLSQQAVETDITGAQREQTLRNASIRNRATLATEERKLAEERLRMIRAAFDRGEVGQEMVDQAEIAAIGAVRSETDAQRAQYTSSRNAGSASILNSLSKAQYDEATAWNEVTWARDNVGKGSEEYNNALAAARQASQASAQAADDQAAAQRELDLVMMPPGDAVGRANKTLQNANAAATAARKYGETSTQYLQAMSAVVEAQRVVDDVATQMVEAAGNMTIANLEYAGDTVGAAQERVRQAEANLARALARSGGADSPDVRNARAALRTTQGGARDATLTEAMDDIDFMQQMDQITSRGAISMLTNLLNMKDLTEDQRNSILLKIKGLQDELSSSMDGVFNLPGEIKVPTPYEVRRALGVDDYIKSMKDATSADAITSAMPGASNPSQILREIQGALASGAQNSVAGAVQDYSNSNNNVTINGASFEQVVAYLNQFLGAGAQVVRTNAGRKGY